MTAAPPAGQGGATRLVRRPSRAVAIVGLAAWAIGSAVALAARALDIFLRVGAPGVAASVLFFTDRLLQIELARQRAVECVLHEYGEPEAMRSGTPPTELPRHGSIIDYLVEERRFGALRQTADRFQAANIGLLIVSTLQWGFGDLLLSALTEGGA